MDDFSGLNDFAVDLAASLVDLPEGTKKAVSKAALEVKKTLRAEAGASVAEARQLAGFIDYTTKATVNVVSAEIGPKRGGPGSFGFLYFGNSKNGPLLPDPVVYARREGEAVAGFLGDLVAKSIGG